MKAPRTVLLILSGILLLSPFGCTTPDTEEYQGTPERIQGTWVTEDPAYENQKLVLLNKAVLVYTEKEAFDDYAIKVIRESEEESGTLFEIDHAGWDGGEITLSLILQDGDSTMVFKNQPFRVWRKLPTAP